MEPETTMSTSDHARVLAEHEGIQVGLDRLEIIARAGPAEMDEFRYRRLLEHDTVALQQLLLPHFVFEEDGGYMLDVINSRPDMCQRVTELRTQHDQMRMQLARILASLRGGDLGELRMHVREFVELARTHESDETEMLMDSATVDHGVAD